MEFRVRRQPSGDLESDLFDVDPLLDARNRFARKAQLYIDDLDGSKQDDYRFYQRVDIEAREDFNDSFGRLFSGIVVETHDKEQNGADILEGELYSYDYLLRTDQIDLDVSGQNIATALENIIAESPVYWNANNVDVGDEQELNRTFVAEKIDSAIGELASLSENEIYGVNDDLEFFFTPPEPTKSDENITNSDWLEYDFPELDKESINEVTVYYGPDGEGGKVTVDDAPDKLDRETKLNSDGAPTNYIERTFESITDSKTAEAKAKEIRERYSRLVIGNVRTWKPLLNTDPGDTIDITIDQINIDDEFQIADINRRWGKGMSELTVVGNVGDDEELLVELTDRVDRIEAQRSNRDVAEDRITDTEVRVAISPEISMGDRDAPSVRLTNKARTLIRDGWRGEGNLNITDIAIGDDNSNLSRTNTTLENQTAEASATETLPDSETVEYEADLGEANTREVGLFTQSDELIVRGIFEDTQFSGGLDVLEVDDGETYSVGEESVDNQIDNAGTMDLSTTYNISDGASGLTEIASGETLTVTTDALESYFKVENAGTIQNAGTIRQASQDAAGPITITLPVNDDPDLSYGVVTDIGQTSIRDIVADNSPVLPQFYAYGDDATDPSETDTALGNQLDTENLDRILVQSADSDSEWESVVGDISDDTPLEIAGGELTTKQTGFTTEAEHWDREEGAGLSISDSRFSNGEAEVWSTDYTGREYDFTVDHRIPGGELEIAYRNEGDDSGGSVPNLIWYIDGEQVGKTNHILSLEWAEVFTNGFNTVTPPELAPGPHTLKIENDDSGGGGGRYVDVVAPRDGRYSYTDDNTVSSGALSGPELYPNLVEVEFSEATTRRNATEAEFLSSWDDVSNDQYIAVKNSDVEGYIISNNDQSTIETFASAETNVQAKVGISRYGSQTSTPTSGINGQSVDFYDLFADPDAITKAGIGKAETRAPFGDLGGTTIREAGQLTAGRETLTRSIFSEYPSTGTIKTDTTVISSEILGVK